jgi:translation elongation factor EF-G
MDQIESAPAGSIVLLTGLDQFITVGCTITDSESAHAFKPIEYIKFEQVRATIEMMYKKDMDALVSLFLRIG